MPLNGAGSFTPITPNYPAIPGTDILASDRNAIDEDIATALTNALYRDGQAIVVANIPFAGFKLTGVGTGTASTDATNVLQVFTSPTFTDVTLAGTTLAISATAVTTTSATINLTASVVTMTTQAEGDNSTKGATTAHVQTAIASKAPLASPALTGIPTAPTAAPGTVTTQIATTAFADALAFSAALPSQTGQSGFNFITTNGTTASWTPNPVHLLLVNLNII